MAGEYNFAVPLREFDNAAHLTSNLLAAGLPVRSVSQRSDGTYTVTLQPGATQAQRDQASAMAASYVNLRYKTPNELASDISSMQAVDYGKLTDMIFAMYTLEHPGLIATINAAMSDTVAATVAPTLAAVQSRSQVPSAEP